MIRINLIKEEKRRFALPSISLAQLKQYEIKDLLKEKAILIAPAIGVLILAGEIFYAFRLKGEISSLQREVTDLTAQRNKLKKKANVVQARKRALRNEINTLKRRIKQLELSKDVIIVLKNYYAPFNESLGYFYSHVPSTVWLNSLSQRMDFQKVNVELSFGSYDIDSIKNFFTTIKREFSELTPSEIRKQENKNGIMYYVSSIKAGKHLTSGVE
jgi:outer membrane murein-binding lipoprotein Lpp